MKLNLTKASELKVGDRYMAHATVFRVSGFGREYVNKEVRIKIHIEAVSGKGFLEHGATGWACLAPNRKVEKL